MGNENSDAQNNQKCGNSFKHRPILRNRPIERSDLFAQSKKFYWLSRFELFLRIFSNGVVLSLATKTFFLLRNPVFRFTSRATWS